MLDWAGLGLDWAGLGWAGLGWAGLGWAGLERFRASKSGRAKGRVAKNNLQRRGAPRALETTSKSAPGKQTVPRDTWQKAACKKKARFARSRRGTLALPLEAALSSGSLGI